MRKVFTMCLGMLLASHAAEGQTIAGDSPDFAGIRARFCQLYNRGDTTGLAALYTADAVRMPYDAPAVSGRAQIIASFATAFATRKVAPELSLVAQEVVTSGNRMVERGSYHEILRRPNGETAATEDGKYVALLTRGTDGVWRYQWSIFNRDRGSLRTSRANLHVDVLPVSLATTLGGRVGVAGRVVGMEHERTGGADG